MGRDHIFKMVIPIMILTIIITTSLMVCWAEDNPPQKIESGNRQSKSIDGDDYIDPTQPTSKLPIDGDDYIDPSTLEDLNSQELEPNDVNPNSNDNNYILTNPNYGFTIENKTNPVEIKNEFWQPIRYPQNYGAIDTNLKNQTVNSGVKKDLGDRNIEVNRILKVNDLNTQSSSNFSNFNNWRPINGNWSLITENIKMMRQTNTSDFCYLTTGLDTWKDYTIQTKIRPLYFAGADQPFGIIARFKDTNNFYYVRMSNANILEIRKKVHGTIISLARKTYPVKSNTWYTLKLVMQGERIECFVDNQRELFAKESKLPFGQIGIFMDGVGAEITDLKVSFF